MLTVVPKSNQPRVLDSTNRRHREIEEDLSQELLLSNSMTLAKEIAAGNIRDITCQQDSLSFIMYIKVSARAVISRYRIFQFLYVLAVVVE